MLKWKHWIWIAASTFSLVAQAEVMQSEPRAIKGAFDSIDIAGNNRVLVTVGSDPKLDVSSHDNLAQVITEIKGGTLYIYEKNTTHQANTTKPIISVTVPKLTTMNTAGDAIVTVTGIDTKVIHLTTNGKSYVTLQGIVERFALQTKGKSDINALKLKVEQADVETYGKSEVKLNVSDNLKVTSYGKANVYYIGTPKVTPMILGQGEVKPM